MLMNLLRTLLDMIQDHMRQGGPSRNQNIQSVKLRPNIHALHGR